MESEKTLYKYVYRMILNDIYNEKYAYHDKLPSLNEFCQTFSVGRNTVRNALGKLQEDGFVHLDKGAKARVIINVRDIESNYQYRLTLLNCRQMTSDIYDALGMFLPEVTSVCLQKATKEEMNTLIEMSKKIIDDSVTTQSEMIDRLFSVYRYGFGIVKNPVLLDLILTLLYSVNQPLSEETHKKEILKFHLNGIQKTVSSLFPLALKGNDFLIRRLISLLCSTYRKISTSYYDSICMNMTPTHNAQFMWVSNRNEEFLYARVLLAAISDISAGVYQKNTLLPSIQKVSEIYGVSIRTSRKVLALLKEYQIIETVNGVGSCVALNGKEAVLRILENPEIIDKLKRYYDAQEVLNWIAVSALPSMLKQVDGPTLNEIAKELLVDHKYTLEYLYDYLFSLCNACLQNIYKELKRSMGWRIIVHTIVDYENCSFDFKGMRDRLIIELKKKRTAGIVSSVKKIGEANLLITKQIIEQHIN